MNLPSDSKARKDTPIFSGVLKYFPLALAEIAKLSLIGNDKHNPGEPLHWSKGKSTDHGDCLVRHQIDVGTIDPDTITERFPKGLLHDVHVAWRALAQLQVALEYEQAVGALMQKAADSPPPTAPAPPYDPWKRLQEAPLILRIDPAMFPPPPAGLVSLMDAAGPWPEPKGTSGIGVSWGDGNFPATETI